MVHPSPNGVGPIGGSPSSNEVYLVVQMGLVRGLFLADFPINTPVFHWNGRMHGGTGLWHFSAISLFVESLAHILATTWEVTVDSDNFCIFWTALRIHAVSRLIVVAAEVEVQTFLPALLLHLHQMPKQPKTWTPLRKRNTTLKREHHLRNLLLALVTNCCCGEEKLQVEFHCSSLFSWLRWSVWPWHCSTDVKSEWCTPGNAWVAAGRQITELSPNENYLQIIPHSELSSNYLWIARQEPMVVLVLCHEIFFNPLSVADCQGCPWNENNWLLNIWLWDRSSRELWLHWQRLI